MFLMAKLGRTCGEATLGTGALDQVENTEVGRTETASLDFTLCGLSGTLDSSAGAGGVPQNDDGIWTVITLPCTRSYRSSGLSVLRGSTVTRSEG